MKRLSKVLVIALILNGVGVFSQDCSLFNVYVGGANICSGVLFTLTPIVVGANGAVIYSWSTAESTPTIQKGRGSYTLIVTDTLGCVDSATAVIIEDPQLTVVIPGPIALCELEDTVLISNYKAIDGYNFVWAKGSTPIGNTTESITVNTSGIYSLNVEKGGCSGSATVSVTIHAPPVVIGSASTICSGSSVTLGQALVGGAYSYQWGNGATSATIVSTTGGVYTRKATTIEGCSSTSTHVVTAMALPIINVLSETRCAGESMVLSDTQQSAGYSYVWSPGNLTTAKVTPTTSTTFSVTKTDNATGCSATSGASAIFIAIPSVFIAADTTIVCYGTSANLFATHDASSLYWSDGSTASNISVSTQGTYAATASNGGCSASDSIYVKILGVNESQTDSVKCQSSNTVNFVESEEFVVYPNPCKDELSILGSTNWTITNVFGQITKQGTTTLIDVSGLRQGMYIILDNFTGTNKRFVKE